MRSVFEQTLIGLICLALVAVFVSGDQGSKAISSLGQLLVQLINNVVGSTSDA